MDDETQIPDTVRSVESKKEFDRHRMIVQNHNLFSIIKNNQNRQLQEPSPQDVGSLTDFAGSDDEYSTANLPVKKALSWVQANKSVNPQAMDEGPQPQQPRDKGVLRGGRSKPPSTTMQVRESQKQKSSLELCGKNLSWLSAIDLGRSLVKIDLSNNQLCQLPDRIIECRYLEELELSYNKLERLPSGWAQLIKLRRLIFRHNCLEELPSDLGQCSSLQQLEVDNNPLFCVPCSLVNLSQLSKFTIDWLRYLDPVCKDGSDLIREFCGWQLTVDHEPGHLQMYSFFKFLCFAHIAKPVGQHNLTAKEIRYKFNHEVRFGLRRRCIIQQMVKQLHGYLLKRIVAKPIEECPFGKVFFYLVDLNIRDSENQTPIVSALRLRNPDLAGLLIQTLKENQGPQSRELPSFDDSHADIGNCFHIAAHLHPTLLSEMLSLGKGNPAAEYKHGETILHFTLVKFDDHPAIAQEIVRKCIGLSLKQKFSLNKVDDFDKTPLLVAIKKQHFKGVTFCVKMNKDHCKPLFDFNFTNKKGNPILHQILTQDHFDQRMFRIVLSDPFINVFATNSRFLRPRQETMIFSSSYRMLFAKELRDAKRRYERYSSFISFNEVHRPARPSLRALSGHLQYQPVSVINRVPRHWDNRSYPKRRREVSELGIRSEKGHDNSIGSRSLERLRSPEESAPSFTHDYSTVRNHTEFYSLFQPANSYTDHKLLNFRRMKLIGKKKNFSSLSKPAQPLRAASRTPKNPSDLIKMMDSCPNISYQRPFPTMVSPQKPLNKPQQISIMSHHREERDESIISDNPDTPTNIVVPQQKFEHHRSSTVKMTNFALPLNNLKKQNISQESTDSIGFSDDRAFSPATPKIYDAELSDRQPTLMKPFELRPKTNHELKFIEQVPISKILGNQKKRRSRQPISNAHTNHNIKSAALNQVTNPPEFCQIPAARVEPTLLFSEDQSRLPSEREKKDLRKTAKKHGILSMPQFFYGKSPRGKFDTSGIKDHKFGPKMPLGGMAHYQNNETSQQFATVVLSEESIKGRAPKSGKRRLD